LGFKKGVAAQRTPVLIPELKNITSLAAGTNHILALDSKGRVFAWGAGEQNQLARRVVSRTATGALVPREFGLQRKKIAKIGCGDYHSFAVDKNGNVYSWGLNTFGQTGIPKDEDDESDTITTPTLVESLKGYDIKQIVGGGHHSLSVTESGQVLVWGRIDNAQSGMEISKLNKDDLFFDEHGKPRFLVKPTVIPDINGEYVSVATDTCIVVTKEGKAYSWGFSANYQTGQGTTDDITEATLLDNSAVKDEKLVWCGAGGQFSVLAAEAKDKDTELTNGVKETAA
jgi:regulator of chromosome condensation